jgi:hypothetical protein
MFITPEDLEWHVSTAFDRLLLHGSMLAVVAAALFLAPESRQRRNTSMTA